MELNVTNGVALFTDGSSWDKDRSGGWAWVAIDAYDGEIAESGAVSDTTNNRMEMQAWIEGLTSLHDKFGPCEILIYCDSQVIGRGFNGTYERKSNLDLWEGLQAAADKHHYVEWIWIRGHNGNKYNHKADKLASEARKNGKEKGPVSNTV